MAQRKIIVTAPEELLTLASQIAVKNIATLETSEFITQSGENHFLVRGIKAGVSVRYLSSRDR